MFRSIRWRLVASYTLMTILTVTLLGILALFLIERYLLHQEHDYLTMNATAVAAQVEPMLQAQVAQPALVDVVRTTAFLGDMQVRILDAEAQLLADSGQPTQADAVTFVLAQPAPTLMTDTAISIVGQPDVVFQVAPVQMVAPPVLPDQAGRLIAPVPSALPPMVVFRREAELWNAGPDVIETQRITTGGVAVLPPGLSVSTTGEVTSYLIDTTPADFSVRSLVNLLAPDGQRVVKTIEKEGAVVGYVEVRSEPDFAGGLLLIRRAFFLAGIGVSLVALLIALWMSRSLTAPLQDLIETTAQMQEGALSARAAVRTQDEIGLLATQFNTMATQLERSFAELAAERDALRRFVADASHELRTPITALKTFTELLQGPAGDQLATRTEFLQESQQQLQRLEWTTGALLQLSRLDGGLLELKTASLDLRELLAPVLKAFAARAQEKTLTLTLSAPATPILAVGNAAYLEMAVANLVDNALKFTPANGKVELGVTYTTAAPHPASATSGPGPTLWAMLWVQDSGIGIAPEDRPYVFDRFYRGQRSVANYAGAGAEGNLPATPADPGCGLGLAIVQSIVKAHNGEVSVASEVGLGSRFVIMLPVVDPAVV